MQSIPSLLPCLAASVINRPHYALFRFVFVRFSPFSLLRQGSGPSGFQTLPFLDFAAPYASATKGLHFSAVFILFSFGFMPFFLFSASKQRFGRRAQNPSPFIAAR
ncbi:MAG: hypothetical protein LBD02_03565 [Christensenellaceae bacterium]|jgi:hypothetical protein|nr:hypothetical protein [Christensenellaceae bacterium]